MAGFSRRRRQRVARGERFSRRRRQRKRRFCLPRCLQRREIARDASCERRTDQKCLPCFSRRQRKRRSQFSEIDCLQRRETPSLPPAARNSHGCRAARHRKHRRPGIRHRQPHRQPVTGIRRPGIRHRQHRRRKRNGCYTRPRARPTRRTMNATSQATAHWIANTATAHLVPSSFLTAPMAATHGGYSSVNTKKT